MNHPRCLLCLLAFLVSFRPASAAGEWLDCLAPGAAATSAPVRQGDDALEVRAPEAESAVVLLAAACPEAFDLEAELRWSLPRRKEGRADLLVGPHAFGSGGYRIAAGPGPWDSAECRVPRWEAEQWQKVEVRVRPGWLDYHLDGRLVARSPAEAGAVAGVRLALSAGTRLVLRRCRLRPAPERPAPQPIPRLVYQAAASLHAGRPVPDGLASGGLAVEASGAGRDRPLLGGHDATLGAAGRYTAIFGLRGAEGAGRVWLEVACVEGRTLGSAAVLLEELPSERYARLRVPFTYQPGAPIEFRLAAERGRLRVDEVAVEPVGAEAVEAAAVRPRRPLPLADAWGKAPGAAAVPRDAPLAIMALERRLADGGWYEFRVRWRQDAAPHAESLALDLWVACRDPWGIVRVFDHGAAWGSVPRGQQETAAWLDPASIPRYGPPVALLAQLYHRGAPVAAASRKWGIPVDDVHIVGAQRVGPLHPRPPVTE